MLNWANRFSIFCFLDNHRYQTNYHSVECLLAAGAKNSFTGNTLSGLQEFIDEGPRWLFGHLGYGLKSQIEGLRSSRRDRVGFPDSFFFEPEVMIRLSEKEMKVEVKDEVEDSFGESERIFF